MKKHIIILFFFTTQILDTVDVQIVASEELRAKSGSPVVLNTKNNT